MGSAIVIARRNIPDERPSAAFKGSASKFGITVSMSPIVGCFLGVILTSQIFSVRGRIEVEAKLPPLFSVLSNEVLQ